MPKIEEIFRRLREPIPKERLSSKKIQGNLISFVSWVDLCDLLDERAVVWTWQIVSIQELSALNQVNSKSEHNEPITRKVGGRLVMLGSLTIYAEDRTLTMQSTGEELLNCSSYGDPSSNAEAMAFRRCCAKFGLGRSLWRKK